MFKKMLILVVVAAFGAITVFPSFFLYENNKVTVLEKCSMMLQPFIIPTQWIIPQSIHSDPVEVKNV